MTGDQLITLAGTTLANGSIVALISWVIKNGMTAMAKSIEKLAENVQAFQLTQAQTAIKNNQMLTILVYDKLFQSTDPAVTAMIKTLITEGMAAAPPVKQ